MDRNRDRKRYRKVAWNRKRARKWFRQGRKSQIAATDFRICLDLCFGKLPYSLQSIGGYFGKRLQWVFGSCFHVCTFWMG